MRLLNPGFLIRPRKRPLVVGGSPPPPPFYTIPTPVLTNAVPPKRQSEPRIDVSGYIINLYWHMQIAGNAAFTTPLFGEGAIRGADANLAARQITISDFTDDDLNGEIETDPFPELANLPSGDTHFRLRIGHDANDGLGFTWGNWSNTIFENIVLLNPSIFADTPNKGAQITRSNGNLTVTSVNSNVGAAQFARIDNSRTGKRHIEFTVNAISSNTAYVGIGPSGFAYNSTGTVNVPGSAGSPAGFSIASTGVAYHAGGTTNSVTPNWQVGDIIILEFDEGAADKVWVGHSRGGVLTWNGNPAAGTGGFLPTGLDLWFAFAALFVKITAGDIRQITVNAGASAFAHAPSTGFLGYDQS